jgi:hypothetical protein
MTGGDRILNGLAARLLVWRLIRDRRLGVDYCVGNYCSGPTFCAAEVGLSQALVTMAAWLAALMTFPAIPQSSLPTPMMT